MKKGLLLSSILLISLASCDVVVVEEPVVYIDPRDHFTGVFDVEEYSETMDIYHYYTIDIVKAADFPGSVYLRNFYGENIDVIADVEGDHLYIPEQEIDGFHIQGDGFIHGDRLDLSYSVHDHLAYDDFVNYCSTIAWR